MNSKKFRRLYLIFIIFISFITPCFADIMPMNSHSVDRCVKIIENKDIKDIALKYKITGPMIEGLKIWDIEYNTCLSKWYKFNSFEVFLEKNWKEEWIWDIETWWWYVDNSNPLIEENIIYKLLESNWKYILKEISNDNWLNFITIKTLFQNKLFLISLFLTIFIETIILFIIKNFLKLPINNKRLLFAWIVCSLFTLPILWLFKWIWISFFDSFITYIIFWETLVFFVEAIMLKFILKISWKQSFIFSFICNLGSYFIWMWILKIFNF